MPKIYTAQTWVDEILSGSERYNILDNGGNPMLSNVQINLGTGVSVAGSPMSASRLNHIEAGLDALDIRTLPIYNLGSHEGNTPLNQPWYSAANLNIMTTDSYAIDKGASISLGGKFSSVNLTPNPFARIHGKKESNVDGATSGYLAFETNQQSTNSLVERMRIKSDGRVVIPGPLTSMNGVTSTLVQNQTEIIFRVSNEGVFLVSVYHESGGNSSWSGLWALMVGWNARIVTIFETNVTLINDGSGGFDIRLKNTSSTTVGLTWSVLRMG